MNKFLFLLSLLVFISSLPANSSGDDKPERKNTTPFTITHSIPTTSVKDQHNTNTCWSFATLSFIESELLRTEGKEYDLSEMFIVRNVYTDKASRYVRMHGNSRFAGGGEPNDVMNIIRTRGIIPEEVYSGLLPDTVEHTHNEMDVVLKNYVSGIVNNPNEKLSTVWQNGFSSILDTYLGKEPETFTDNENTYTAKKFAESLNFNPDEYVLISSFTHHPYYKPFILEVPDNWSWGEVYNLPLNEFVDVTMHSIKNGYSVVWAADYSEDGFLYKKGFAVAPEDLYLPQVKSKKKKAVKGSSKVELDHSVEEFKVTQENRQKGFDDYSTQDDHAMHIVGLAKDDDGKQFYYVKNSWGTNNLYDGYFFVSQAYFKYKSISIMLHKDAIPAAIKQKLSL